MIGFIFLVVVLAAVAYLLLSEKLKGFRTQIFGYATVALGSVVPLAGQVVDYLQTLDWRQYVLNADKKNLTVLAIVGGLGIMAVLLRHITTGPVGTKD